MRRKIINWIIGILMLFILFCGEWLIDLIIPVECNMESLAIGFLLIVFIVIMSYVVTKIGE